MDWNEAIEVVKKNEKVNEVVGETFEDNINEIVGEDMFAQPVLKYNHDQPIAIFRVYLRNDKRQERARNAVQIEEYVASKDVVKEGTVDINWNRKSIDVSFEPKPIKELEWGGKAGSPKL